MTTNNRFSDRLQKVDRMKAYTHDTSVAEGIVQNEAPASESATPETKDKKADEIEKADPKGSAPEKRKMDSERIMAYASSKQRKVANSITLSNDVVTAVNGIVSQLKDQGFETNKSTVIDELLREKLTDLGLL